jgi:1-acyl-sn-glycerol-3-phosphate acyltransferase
MIAQVRGLRRLAAVLLCLGRGAYRLRRHGAAWTPDERALAVQQWAAAMLRTLGVDCHTSGQPADGPMLCVANHIAWLDILVLHALRHSRFVAKSEVHHWPLIGFMAAGAGTLFIERRSRRDAMRVVHDMAHRLAAGDTITIFPEGTTSLGDTVLPFHANLLQAAIATRTPVQPLLIRYTDANGQRATHVRYVDEDTLVVSVWRVMCAPYTSVHVHWAEPQQAQGRDRRAWASDLRQSLLALMG